MKKRNLSKILPTIFHSSRKSSPMKWLSNLSVILQTSFRIPLPSTHSCFSPVVSAAVLASSTWFSFCFSLVGTSCTRSLPPMQGRRRIRTFNHSGTGVDGTLWYMFKTAIWTTSDKADTQMVVVRYTAVRENLYSMSHQIFNRMGCVLLHCVCTVKPVCNDHLFNKIFTCTLFRNVF